MNHKFMINKKKLIVFLIIMITLIIIGVVKYKTSKKEKTKVDISNLIIDNISTENIKENAPLIDMKNTQNAKIEYGEKINISENIKKETEIAGLKITNARLHTKSGLSYFNATVENTTMDDFSERIINISFKKNDGSNLKDVEAVIPAIKAKGFAKINVSTTADIVNAEDFNIELK